MTSKFSVDLTELEASKVLVNLTNSDNRIGGPSGSNSIRTATAVSKKNKSAKFVVTLQKITPVTGVQNLTNLYTGVAAFIFENGDRITSVFADNTLAQLISGNSDVNVGELIFRGDSSVSKDSKTFGKEYIAYITLKNDKLKFRFDKNLP